ncbi:Transcription initiation protein spt3, partial [Coemansia sp. S610]
IIDILGFLTFEMVSKLTESALKIKRGLDKAASDALCVADGASKRSGTAAAAVDLQVDQPSKSPSAIVPLFSGPPTARSPLQVQHVQEAFRRLQRAPQPIRNFKGGLTRTRVSLI